MKRSLKFLNNNIEVILAATALIIFASLTILQVVLRKVFNNPLSWSEELARYLFIWFVFLSGSYAVKFQKHVKLSFFIDRLKKPFNMYFQLVALILWLLFLFFLNVYSIKVVSFIYSTGQTSSANNIPMYLIYLSLTVGSILMTIRVITHIYIKVNKIREFKIKTSS